MCTLSSNTLGPEREAICGQCPGPLSFPEAIMNLTIAGQPCFERGKKGSFVNFRGGYCQAWARPGDHRKAHDCNPVSKHSNLRAYSGDVVGGCQICECLSRPKVNFLLVHKLLKNRDFVLCLLLDPQFQR